MSAPDIFLLVFAIGVAVAGVGLFGLLANGRINVLEFALWLPRRGAHRRKRPLAEPAGDDLMAVAEAVREPVRAGRPVTGPLSSVHYECFDRWDDGGEPCKHCAPLLPRRAAS